MRIPCRNCLYSSSYFFDIVNRLIAVLFFGILSVIVARLSPEELDLRLSFSEFSDCAQ